MQTKGLCEECSKHNTCTKLCVEAEKYVNQDYIGSRESINPMGDISDIYENTPAKEWPDLVENIHLTKREKEIITLLGKGLNRKDICELLNMNRPNLRNHIKRLKNKLRSYPN